VGKFAALLARDHEEMDRMLAVLCTTRAGSVAWRAALDGLRMAFAAHAEAQAHALEAVAQQSANAPALISLIDEVSRDHRDEERMLEQLLGERLTGEHAVALRTHLRHHAEHEQSFVLPYLRDALRDGSYTRLAPLYATHRIIALGLMEHIVPRHAFASGAS
jgi:hypothetical protein